jgi:microcystin-dependent protein
MSEPYIGEIRMFGFTRVPTGWAACDGSLLSIADYEVLYTLLGAVPCRFIRARALA